MARGPIRIVVTMFDIKSPTNIVSAKSPVKTRCGPPPPHMLKRASTASFAAPLFSRAVAKGIMHAIKITVCSLIDLYADSKLRHLNPTIIMHAINAAKAFGTILNTISAIITPMLKIAYGALSGALAISESSAGMPITANPMSSENSLFIKFCGPTTSTRSPTFNLALDISPFSGFPFLLSPMAFSPNSFLSLISERVLPMYSDSGRTEISAMPICMDLSSRFFP